MKKIEQEMLEAVNSVRNWSNGNTQVSFLSGQTTPIGYVYLHGNHVASVVRSIKTGNMEAFPNLVTLTNGPTVTTKSRLRALGVNLTQTKGKIYIDNNFICEA